MGYKKQQLICDAEAKFAIKPSKILIMKAEYEL